MRLQIDPGRRSVPPARHWAAARARDAGLPAHLIGVVALLTSELVANAVIHATGTIITLRIIVEPDRFTAAVSDGSDDLPIPRTTGPEVPGGHGIRLIEALADSWGTETHPDGGKTIWFTVHHDQPPHPAW